MTEPVVDPLYLQDMLVRLLKIPSPSGLTDAAIDWIQETLGDGLRMKRTRKGSLVAEWLGVYDDHPRAITAHVDTLGAMVKEIKPNGRLRLTKIGGFNWSTVEGEGCSVLIANGKAVRGTILLTKASAHVHGGKELEDTKRSDENIEVRLDIRTRTKHETEMAGISIGDYVVFDPRVEQNEGFIRSRHLDDKAGVVLVLAAVEAIRKAGLKPAQTTYLHFSNYEEEGHGASAGIPESAEELVAVDMAAVGEGQASDEFHASLCVKDSGGPYHHGLVEKLKKIAKDSKIPFVTDIYPYYGSDGEAYWKAGGDVAVALIGPGVDASHHYERTHMDALTATANWLIAYLLSEK